MVQNHSQNITLNGTWSTVIFPCSIQCKTLNETHTQPQQMTRSDEMHTKHCFFGVASMKTKGEPRTCCNHWTVPSTCFMIAVLSNRTLKSFSFYQLRFILLCETFTAEKKTKWEWANFISFNTPKYSSFDMCLTYSVSIRCWWDYVYFIVGCCRWCCFISRNACQLAGFVFNVF